ncbi:MAG TPA: hypothetical protein VF505_09120 [Thermoanaerobaculia bacterium]
MRNYSLGLDLGLNAQSGVQATFPPVIHDFSTGNPQASPPRIRSKSARFPHDLHTFFTLFDPGLFIGICGAFPKSISRLDHKKNGGNQAGAVLLRKSGSLGRSVAGSLGFPLGAHRVWHVERLLEVSGCSRAAE